MASVTPLRSGPMFGSAPSVRLIRPLDLAGDEGGDVCETRYRFPPGAQWPTKAAIAAEQRRGRFLLAAANLHRDACDGESLTSCVVSQAEAGDIRLGFRHLLRGDGLLVVACPAESAGTASFAALAEHIATLARAVLGEDACVGAAPNRAHIGALDRILATFFASAWEAGTWRVRVPRMPPPDDGACRRALDVVASRLLAVGAPLLASRTLAFALVDLRTDRTLFFGSDPTHKEAIMLWLAAWTTKEKPLMGLPRAAPGAWVRVVISRDGTAALAVSVSPSHPSSFFIQAEDKPSPSHASSASFSEAAWQARAMAAAADALGSVLSPPLDAWRAPSLPHPPHTLAIATTRIAAHAPTPPLPKNKQKERGFREGGGGGGGGGGGEERGEEAAEDAAFIAAAAGLEARGRSDGGDAIVGAVVRTHAGDVRLCRAP